MTKLETFLIAVSATTVLWLFITELIHRAKSEKIIKEVELLYIIAYTKIQQDEFHDRAIPYGYMQGIKIALEKMKEIL